MAELKYSFDRKDYMTQHNMQICFGISFHGMRGIIRDEKFPKPIKCGARNYWKIKDVEKFMKKYWLK